MQRRRLLADVVGMAALLICAACATTNVLVQAPEEFWQTVEKLLLALWDDISTMLLVFGL